MTARTLAAMILAMGVVGCASDGSDGRRVHGTPRDSMALSVMTEIYGAIPDGEVCMPTFGGMAAVAEVEYDEIHEPDLDQDWPEYGYSSHFVVNRHKHPPTWTIIAVDHETGEACARAFGVIVEDDRGI